MPEPDIPPKQVSSKLIVDQRQHLPDVPLDHLLLRSDRNQWIRWTTDFHLSTPAASRFMHRRQSIQWLEQAIPLGGNPQKMAEWIQTGLVKEPMVETLLCFVERQKLIDQKKPSHQHRPKRPVKCSTRWTSTGRDSSEVTFDFE